MRGDGISYSAKRPLAQDFALSPHASQVFAFAFNGCGVYNCYGICGVI